MTSTLNELFSSDNERDILITALNQYKKRAETIAYSPLKGYGTASEYQKKEDWKNRVEEIDTVLQKVINEFI